MDVSKQINQNLRCFRKPKERWKNAFLKIREMGPSSLHQDSINSLSSKNILKISRKTDDREDFEECNLLRANINSVVDANANSDAKNGFYSVTNNYDSLRKSVLRSNLTKALHSDMFLQNSKSEERYHSKIVPPKCIIKSVKPIIFLNLETKVKSSTCNLTVILLSGQRLNVKCDANMSGKELLNDLIDHLNIQESHLFGLAVHRDGEFMFVDGHQRIFKLVSSLYPTLSRKFELEITSVLTLYLRIQFYLLDMEHIRHEDTRENLYVQLREDILEEQICCFEDEALFLGGLALQSDFGDFICDTTNYFDHERYLPQRNIRSLGCETAIQNLYEQHSSHKGLSSEVAKIEFLQKVCELQEYGYHFHNVLWEKNGRKVPVWLGISFNGISVFDQRENERCLQQNFPWHEIQKLSFSKEYFFLRFKPSTTSQNSFTNLFCTSESVKSRYLYYMAVCHRQFSTKLSSGCNISDVFSEDSDYELHECLNSGSSSLGSNCSIQDFKNSTCNLLNSFSSSSSACSETSEISRGIPEQKVDLQPLLTNHVGLEALPSINSKKHLIRSAVDSFKSSFLGQTTIHPENVSVTSPLIENEITCTLEKTSDFGLGLILTCSDNCFDGTYIESILSNSPADGILFPGDKILKLNGENIEQHNFLEVVDIIKDMPVFSDISITVKHKTHEDHSEVPVVNKEEVDDNLFMLPKNNVSEDFSKYEFFKTLLSVNGTLDKNLFQPFEDQCLSPPVPKPRKKWVEKGKLLKENESDAIQERAHVSHQCCSEYENSPNSIDSQNSSCCEIPQWTRNDDAFQQISESSCITPDNDLTEDSNLSMEECVFNVTLEKISGSLGFRITQEEHLQGEVIVKGVFVHSLIPNGAAMKDGSIQPGDRLLEINSVPILEHCYSEVVHLLKECPSVTKLVFLRCHGESNSETMIAKWGKRNNNSSTKVSSLQRKNNSNTRRCQDQDDLPLLLTDTSLQSNYVKVNSKIPSSPSYEEHSQRISDYYDVVDAAPGAYGERLRSPTLSNGSSNSSCAKSVYSENIHDETSRFSANNNTMSSQVSNENHYSESIFDELKQSVDFADVFSLSEERPYFGALQDENVKQSVKYQLDHSPDESGIESDAHSAKATDGHEDNYYAHHNLPNVVITPVPKQRKKKLYSFKRPEDVYKVLNPSNTFEVVLRKSTRGLGFSIFGGIDSNFPDPVCRLIRIRKLYPLQPAVECGQLQIGDIILEVNGLRMLGLTHTEALETLRVAPANVILKVFRPDPMSVPAVTDFVKDISPSGSLLLSSPPSSASNSLTRPNSLPLDSPFISEDFEVILQKVDGSLGFSVLYHKETCQVHTGLHPSGIYVKALIRDPAISDGRIQPGDRILKVNDVEVSDMSHAEAVNFLRSAPDFVILKLHRNPEGLSPLSLEDKPFPPKALRQEAKEIVNAQKNNKGSPQRLRDRRKRRANSRELESSASGSDCSNLSPPPSDNNIISDFSNATELAMDSPESIEDLSKGVGLNRNLRPKSLDVLSVNERKQSFGRKDNVDNDDGTFRRQTSVLGTSTDVSSEKIISTQSDISQMDGQGLLKWRGFTLQTKNVNSQQARNQKDIDDIPPVPPRRLESLSSDTNQSPLHSPLSPTNESQFVLPPIDNKIKKFYVELDRGWHGRLGFSVRDMLPEELAENAFRSPVVKAVYPGSLAFSDGRIKEGDILVEVNGETMCDAPASYAIDILRKTRGKIGIVFHRFENMSSEPATSRIPVFLS